MKVNFDYHETTNSIEEQIAKMPIELESRKKTIMKKIALIIKKNVENNLSKSDKDVQNTNYDGTPYVHMKDDVKTSVKDDKAGSIFAIIGGGKQTGYKWHMLENGTSDTSATHFGERSLKQSDNEINEIIDKEIGRMIQD